MGGNGKRIDGFDAGTRIVSREDRELGASQDDDGDAGRSEAVEKAPKCGAHPRSNQGVEVRSGLDPAPEVVPAGTGTEDQPHDDLLLGHGPAVVEVEGRDDLDPRREPPRRVAEHVGGERARARQQADLRRRPDALADLLHGGVRDVEDRKLTPASHVWEKGMGGEAGDDGEVGARQRAQAGQEGRDGRGPGFQDRRGPVRSGGEARQDPRWELLIGRRRPEDLDRGPEQSALELDVGKRSEPTNDTDRSLPPAAAVLAARLRRIGLHARHPASPLRLR